MDNLARVNKLMWDWADFVKQGQTCPGVFQTSAWSTGKPVKARQSAAIRRKRKPLVSGPVPHETRTVRTKIPCTRIAYREERVHRLVMKIPDYMKPAICCLYLRGMNYGDTAIVLGVKTKKVAWIRRKVLTFIIKSL